MEHAGDGVKFINSTSGSLYPTASPSRYCKLSLLFLRDSKGGLNSAYLLFSFKYPNELVIELFYMSFYEPE